MEREEIQKLESQMKIAQLHLYNAQRAMVNPDPRFPPSLYQEAFRRASNNYYEAFQRVQEATRNSPKIREFLEQ